MDLTQHGPDRNDVEDNESRSTGNAWDELQYRKCGMFGMDPLEMRGCGYRLSHSHTH